MNISDQIYIDINDTIENNTVWSIDTVRQSDHLLIENEHYNGVKCINKILIVDDEQFNINSIKIILEYQGCIGNIDCITDFALNGAEALQMVKTNVSENNFMWCDYNLIITDINMPFMDGITMS